MSFTGYLFSSKIEFFVTLISQYRHTTRTVSQTTRKRCIRFGNFSSGKKFSDRVSCIRDTKIVLFTEIYRFPSRVFRRSELLVKIHRYTCLLSKKLKNKTPSIFCRNILPNRHDEWHRFHDGRLQRWFSTKRR